MAYINIIYGGWICRYVLGDLKSMTSKCLTYLKSPESIKSTFPTYCHSLHDYPWMSFQIEAQETSKHDKCENLAIFRLHLRHFMFHPMRNLEYNQLVEDWDVIPHGRSIL